MTVSETDLRAPIVPVDPVPYPETQEVLLNIFSYLSPKDLLRCGLVNHLWKRLSADSSLWKRHYLKLCPGEPITLTIFTKRDYYCKKDDGNVTKELSVFSKTCVFFSDAVLFNLVNKFSRMTVLRIDDLMTEPNLHLTDAGIMKLATNCHFLNEFHLISLTPPDGYPLITHSSLDALVSSNTNLSKLTIDCCPKINSEALCSLLQPLKKLDSLQLSTPAVDDPVVRTIVGKTGLTSLTLVSATFSDAALISLGQQLRQLTHFEVRVFAPITFSQPALVALFSCSTQWKSCTFEQGRESTDADVIKLAETATSLETLYLGKCRRLTKEFINKLNKEKLTSLSLIGGAHLKTDVEQGQFKVLNFQSF